MAEAQFFLALGAALGSRLPDRRRGPTTPTRAIIAESGPVHVIGTGTAAAPWNNQMTWDELEARHLDRTRRQGTTIWDDDGGATGGTQYRKYRATKTFGATDTISTIVAGSETVYWSGRGLRRGARHRERGRP